MNLLVHDLSAAEWAQIADNYKDWAVVSDNGTIRPCIGCFRCWAGGTGECVIPDGYNRMGALIHEADELVVMSRYTYGGFSSFVKNVFDRSLGFVLPEFETVYGEMHHQKRYPEYKPVTFRFRGRGLTEEDKEKARQYVAAVCRNLQGTVKDVIFDECAPEESPAAHPDEPAVSPAVHPAAPADRSGLLFVSCSPRGKGSNTEVFLEKLQEDLGSSADLFSLSPGADLTKIAEAVGRAETVVIGIPLYVDGLPAAALRLMEKVKELGSGDRCKLYAVVNNGLYESRQNVNMLNMLKGFCAENGLVYRGAAAIGAGEVAGLLLRGKKRGLWPARNARAALASLAKAIAADKELEDIYADPFLFPRWLYILIANVNWQMLKRAARKASR